MTDAYVYLTAIILVYTNEIGLVFVFIAICDARILY